MTETKRKFAFFVTPHGYGHAARSSAVMNSIREQSPNACFEIYTRVPVWFFNMSLQDGFNYHEVLPDIGLVQSNSMEEDLPETIQRLYELLPYQQAWVKELARQVCDQRCEAVLCDIAPLGIKVAQAAGLPSILEENFTWDWIYEGYLEQESRFTPINNYLRETFESADHHIRTEPACDYLTPANLTSNVVSRKPRTARAETRARLGIGSDDKMVLVTMGGIVTEYPFLKKLEEAKDRLFLVPGGSESYERRGSLILIPHHSNLYHPDLVEAADAVVGKLGYSTLAETYAAGIPFAFVPRERFRESAPMGRYAREVMGAVEISEKRFFSGEWLDLLPELLRCEKQPPAGPNGADQIAEYILKL